MTPERLAEIEADWESIHSYVSPQAVNELLAAAREGIEDKKDAERLRFQYSCYVKTCSSIGLVGEMSYESWIAALDAARAGK